VAVTGLNQNWETVRVWGKVKNVGQTLLGKIFKENPSMNGVYPGESRSILEVFCLCEGEGEYFCLAEHPIVRRPFSFGKTAHQRKAWKGRALAVVRSTDRRGKATLTVSAPGMKKASLTIAVR
jgi:hypothetical protein